MLRDYGKLATAHLQGDGDDSSSIPRINALMDENGGHRIDLESILWLDGDYGHSRSLKVDEGLCYILQYRQDTLSWWWNRREFRMVMPL